MFLLPAHTKVYLSTGNTDMRKSINTLSLLVEGHFRLNPFSGHMFVFGNRRKNIVKILYWDRNGFALWQKRLEKNYFRWPGSVEEIAEINFRQLSWLLEGIDIRQVHAHEALTYETLF